MEQIDVASVVDDVLAGDVDAYERIIAAYQDDVWRSIARLLYDREATKDLVQETFVKAYETLSRFKGESSFYTWLYRIVVNLAIDSRRRGRRHPTVAIEDQPGGEDFSRTLADDDRADPFEQVRAREIGARVAEAIDELTPDHKAVILLREVEGLSYEDISRVMQCSKGTVMSRLHYARKKLQARLRDLT